MRPISFFIYGSCVTRDPLEELIESGKIKIESYISKTTITSQIHPPLNIVDTINDKNDFLTRMVKIDQDKSFFSEIEEKEFDYLLIDFIDERIPVVDISNSCLTFTRTLSDHSKEINYDKKYDARSSDKYFKNLRLFFNKINTLIPQEKIIIHRAWWARHYQEGENKKVFDKRTLDTVHYNNSILKKLIRY